jgi:hypothetical protein
LPGTGNFLPAKGKDMSNDKQEFDLSQFETTDTAVLTVQDPRGDDLKVDGKPVTITLYGPGSKQHLKAKHVYEAAASARSFAALRNKPVKNAAEEAAKDLAQFLAACTVSVENFPVAAVDIYSNPKLAYITDQVNVFLGSTENFMPPAPKK